ncbi:MAG: hypothetical protein IPL99_08920 [Candidatus Competibacteraceae bacterium]|nr:hypothetical protein [Candidatus Competibacteraceae bacterium]
MTLIISKREFDGRHQYSPRGRKKFLLSVYANLLSRENLQKEQFYNEKGEYAPITETVNLSITKMLNDRQLCALADEITAEALCRTEEDRTEQRLLAMEAA